MTLALYLTQIISDKGHIVQRDDVLHTKFLADMKRFGLRVTHVRQEIFSVLKAADSPLSMQEIVRNTHGAHFVSVYRSVGALHKAGIIKQVPRGFTNMFELSDTYTPHHHHATCEQCGKSTSIHHSQLEDLMDSLTRKAGLQPTIHTFELLGICRHCQI